MFSATLLQKSSNPNPSTNNSSNKDSNLNSNNSSNFRETGIIEKLLPSYGFIQCCERQARLFFHYSQFTGNIDHLKLGDPVEFEMTYDRRTGKPIASYVVKISSEAISEELSSERVTGFITIELSDEKEGRVAYENRGECFFLPFTKEDLDDQVSQLKSKDKVTFYIAKDNSGTLRARHICLQDPHISPQRYQGIICTLKDSFGFIERSDVTREIFFHSSECTNFKQLNLADNVEFSIQTRNSKQVAVNIEKLPEGTVVFEDIDNEIHTGQILETVERGLNHLHSRTHSNSSSSGNEAYTGNIVWTKNGSELEIPFSERDLKGDFTLNVGDYVQFNIAIDRRDSSKHATNIKFLEESFNLSGEKREKGFIILLEDGFGFIKCFNKEATRVLFKYNELIDTNQKINVNDDVEFTLTNDQENSLHATRIKLLPSGSVLMKMFNDQEKKTELQTKRETGFIVQLKSNFGLIRCLNKKGDVVSFKYDNNTIFSLNDEVEFYLNSSPSNVNAVGVKKLPPGTIIKNIIAENQVNEDLFNTVNLLYKNNNQLKDNQQQSNQQFKPQSFNHLEQSNNLLNLNSLNNFNNKLTLNNVNSFSNLNSFNNFNSLGNLNSLNNLNNLNSLNNQFADFTANDKESPICSQLFNLSTIDKLDQQQQQQQSNHLNNHNDNFLNSSYLDFIQQQASSTNDLLKQHQLQQSSINENNVGLKSWERSIQNNSNNSNSNNNNSSGIRSKGHIVALKESFGFIENEDHQFEIFFHFSVFEGNFHNLALGQEVEFVCKLNNGRYSADIVRKKIGQDSIRTNEVLSTVFNGIVTRSVRCFNPEQEDYCGLIECKDDDYLTTVTEFSMTSLANIHDFVQKDDIVTFQIELTNGQIDKKRAVNVKSVREKYQAVVDSIKGSFGFLNYEVEDGKMLFFHLSEVKDPNVNLQEGDLVEFVIVNNKRLKKYSACSLVRISSPNQRPDRLKSKIQGSDDLNQNKNQLIRQPKGPGRETESKV